MAKDCFAPIFRANHWFGCYILRIIYAFFVLPWLVIAAIFSSTARCTLKQTLFKLRKCEKGNQDNTIQL